MRDAWISPAIGTRIGKSGGQLTRDAMMKELDLGNKGDEGCRRVAVEEQQQWR